MAPSDLELLADPARLEVEVARVAQEISAQHPDGVTLVGVLKGSVVFLADLARHVTVPTQIDFVAVTPYDGVSGRTRVVSQAVTKEAASGPSWRRDSVVQAMARHGFQNYAMEWWHFTFRPEPTPRTAYDVPIR